LNDPRILGLTAEYIKIPLRTPFIISIRTATHANVIRWTLRTTEGDFLGECVPVQYVTGETPDSVLGIARTFEARLVSKHVSEHTQLISELSQEFPLDVAARTGVEIALYNAIAATLGKSLHQIFGAKLPYVETDLTLSKVPEAGKIAEAAYNDGFRIFKLKVGGEGVEEDFQRIVQLHKNLPAITVRLDANQGFDVEGALEFIDRVLEKGIPIELMEQPVNRDDLKALDEVARRSPIPIFADEACRTIEEAKHLLSDTNVHGLCIKLMKSGIQGTLDIIEQARESNRKLMISCMLEAEISMAASVALAAGTGAFDYIDLDGHLLIGFDEPFTRFRAEGPRLYPQS
jgi:L-Ala-D/L-Glu epimerase